MTRKLGPRLLLVAVVVVGWYVWGQVVPKAPAFTDAYGSMTAHWEQLAAFAKVGADQRPLYVFPWVTSP